MTETTTRVNELISEIRDNLSQSSSSRRDEIRIMQAMLSDDSYEVHVYDRDGAYVPYNPAKDFKNMCASIMANATKISKAEAIQLMNGYEVTKSEASSMINLSKEFINTFIETGRKLPLGGRETSDISLSIKRIEATTRMYPKKIGVNDDGTDKYSTIPASIPGHTSIRVHAPCPTWVK